MTTTCLCGHFESCAICCPNRSRDTVPIDASEYQRTIPIVPLPSLLTQAEEIAEQVARDQLHVGGFSNRIEDLPDGPSREKLLAARTPGKWQR
jgi:hypothetical protein